MLSNLVSQTPERHGRSYRSGIGVLRGPRLVLFLCQLTPYASPFLLDCHVLIHDIFEFSYGTSTRVPYWPCCPCQRVTTAGRVCEGTSKLCLSSAKVRRSNASLGVDEGTHTPEVVIPQVTQRDVIQQQSNNPTRSRCHRSAHRGRSVPGLRRVARRSCV